MKDLAETKSLILMQSPFIGLEQMQDTMPSIRQHSRRGVRICAFIQIPKENENKWRRAATYEGIRLLLDAGVHVTLRPRIHEKLTILDERVSWEGSLNYLSYQDTTERINRWTDRAKLEEIIHSHTLDGCGACLRSSGFHASSETAVQEQIELMARMITFRRKELGMTQRQLASALGMYQSDISAIEGGQGNLTLKKMLSVCNYLRLGMRAMPWYMLPAVDDAFELQNIRTELIDIQTGNFKKLVKVCFQPNIVPPSKKNQSA